MIDLGRPMEMRLNGAAIAEANALRSAAEDARLAAVGNVAAAVSPVAMAMEVAPVTAPVVAEQPAVAEDPQTLLRFAYLASMGLLTPMQFDSVRSRLAAAGGQVDVPNGAGGTGWNLAF